MTDEEKAEFISDCKSWSKITLIKEKSHSIEPWLLKGVKRRVTTKKTLHI